MSNLLSNFTRPVWQYSQFWTFEVAVISHLHCFGCQWNDFLRPRYCGWSISKLNMVHIPRNQGETFLSFHKVASRTLEVWPERNSSAGKDAVLLQVCTNWGPRKYDKWHNEKYTRSISTMRPGAQASDLWFITTQSTSRKHSFYDRSLIMRSMALARMSSSMAIRRLKREISL